MLLTSCLHAVTNFINRNPSQSESSARRRRRHRFPDRFGPGICGVRQGQGQNVEVCGQRELRRLEHGGSNSGTSQVCAEDGIQAGPMPSCFLLSIYLSRSLSLSQSKSIPLSFLPLSLPMLHCVQGRETEIFARMEIGLTRKGLGFAVDRPTDDLLVQSITKRAMAGMMFHSEFSKLPGSHAGVIWKAMCDMNPPIVIRPLKPKYWLLGKVSIDAGTLCQLH